MSQAFSLYSEITVRQNLELHAKLFSVPRRTFRAASKRWWSASAGGRHRQPAGQSASGHTPAPVAGRRHGAQARVADSGRTDLRRRSGGARRVLATAHRAVAARPGDGLHFHPLHERGRTLRPHVDDACGQGARQRRARQTGREARRQNPGRGLHRLPRRSRRAARRRPASQPRPPITGFRTIGGAR